MTAFSLPWFLVGTLAGIVLFWILYWLFVSKRAFSQAERFKTLYQSSDKELRSSVDENGKLKADIDGLNSTKKDLEANIDDLNKTRASLESNVSDLTETGKNLQAALVLKDDELKAASLRYTNLQNDYYTLNASRADLEAQLSDARNRLPAVESAAENAEKGKLLAEGMLVATAAEVESLKTDKAAFQADQNKLKESHAAELAALAAGAGMAVGTLQSRDKKIAALQQQLAASQADFDRIIGERDNTLGTLGARVNGLQGELNDIGAEHRNSLGTLESRLNQAQGELSEMDAQKVALAAALAAKSAELDRTRSEMGEGIGQRDNAVATLGAKVGDMQGEVDTQREAAAKAAVLAAGAEEWQRKYEALAAQQQQPEPAAAQPEQPAAVAPAAQPQAQPQADEDDRRKLGVAARVTAAAAVAKAIFGKEDKEKEEQAKEAEAAQAPSPGEPVVMAEAVPAAVEELQAAPSESEDEGATRQQAEGQGLVTGKTLAAGAAAVGAAALVAGALREGEEEGSPDVAALNAQVSSLQGDLRSAVESKTLLENEAASLRLRVSELSRESSLMRGKANSEVAGLAASVASTNAALEQRQAELAGLQDQLAAAKREAAMKEQAGAEARADADRQAAKVAALVAGAAAAAAAIRSKDDEIERLRGEADARAGAERELAAARSTADQLDRELKAAQADVSRLEIELSQARAAAAEMSEGDRRPGVAVATLGAAAALAHAMIKDEEEAPQAGIVPASAEDEGAPHVQGFAAVVPATGAVVEKDDDRAAAIATLGAKVSDLDAQLDEALRAKTALENERDVLRAEVDKTRSGSAAELAALTAGAAAAAASLRSKEEEIVRLNADLDAARSDAARRSQDADAARSDMDALQAKAADLDSQVARLRTELIAQTKAQLNADAKAEQLSAELTRKAVQLNEAEATTKRMRADFDSKQSRSGAELAALTAGAVASAAALKGKDEEIAALKTQVAEVDKLKAELGDVQRRYDEAVREAQQLRADGDSLRAAVQERDSALEKARAEVAALQSDLAEAQKPAVMAKTAEAAVLAAAEAEIQSEEEPVPQFLQAPAAKKSAAKPASKQKKAPPESKTEHKRMPTKMVKCPQHLSQVKGVGQTYEQALYAAGIGTYWQLAHASDDEMTRVFGLKTAQSGSFLAIREEALKLAGETNAFGSVWDGSEPDDLEKIEGIGKVYEQRLYNAGLCTYAALAASSVAQLESICGMSGVRKPNCADWIKQAKRLAK